MGLSKKLVAETLGTAWLILGGVGAAVFTATYPDLGIGFLGVSIAFGLAIVGAAFAFGHISGAHFNPAVTLGLAVAGRFQWKHTIPYIIAQVVGGLIGAWIVYEICTGKAGFDVTKGFASTGFGEHSPGGYSQHAVFLAEAVLTFFLVTIILNVTANEGSAPFAPLAIGLTIALLCLVAIPVSYGSFNPARSTATALFQGGWPVDQLWLFWAAPIAGGVVAGTFDRLCSKCCGGGCCGGKCH
jgi:aquaporin Z